jgi:predicted  nucleic acid-binding Zn-ribbon protein
LPASGIKIKEETRKLVELQEIDKQIFNLNKEKAEHPRILQSLQENFDCKKANLKSLEENKQQQQMKQKEYEIELGTKEENIKKSQSQLGQLKTNKDYQIKLTEIESFKADKSINEEKILKLMDEIDGFSKSIDAEKEVLKTEEKKWLEEKNAISNRSKDIDARLNDLQGKRKILSASIHKRVLEQYEHILAGKEGFAIVKVKDNSCYGCFMKVPHQVINEIKMYERLVTCEICSRILYLEEDIQP